MVKEQYQIASDEKYVSYLYDLLWRYVKVDDMYFYGCFPNQNEEDNLDELFLLYGSIDAYFEENPDLRCEEKVGEVAFYIAYKDMVMKINCKKAVTGCYVYGAENAGPDTKKRSDIDVVDFMDIISYYSA